MKIPNFFIIGAPKCGTTSLAVWLAGNPHVYMSAAKEPHHFNTDENHVIYDSRAAYERLFEKAGNSHQAVGEASVWYLHSAVAVPNIEKYTRQKAHYLVCLRNPIEMAYALHEQQIVNGNEHIEDFSAAWELSDARSRGEAVSQWCREPRHLAYQSACLLGAQLQRLYQQVPRERVHVVLLDDVKENPRSAYLEVLRFLNVADDGRVEFAVENTAKERKSMLLRRLVQVLGGVKRSLGFMKGWGVLNAIDRRNMRYRPRQPLPAEMRRRMQDFFREDIALLERLLGRDLSHWLAG